ncbi:hypothetical protein MRX96_007056 [Rhipicephalus microplus]
MAQARYTRGFGPRAAVVAPLMHLLGAAARPPAPRISAPTWPAIFLANPSRRRIPPVAPFFMRAPLPVVLSLAADGAAGPRSPQVASDFSAFRRRYATACNCSFSLSLRLDMYGGCGDSSDWRKATAGAD